METIAFIKPNYEGEQRIALLPGDIEFYKKNFFYKNIIIENGFGKSMGISDNDYINVGCTVRDRKTCFNQKTIFSLKLIQPIDYQLLKFNTNIIGWMHPFGSGKMFYETVVREKQISIFDIDSIYPRIFRPDNTFINATGLPPHLFWENSYIAGRASTMMGMKHLERTGRVVESACVLGTGSVAQGAFQHLSSLGVKPRMFGRKTLGIFKTNINEYNLIINGIEMDEDGKHILSINDLKKTRPEVLIIDAAADAGRAIEGTSYQKISSPIGFISDREYISVNNAPTILFKEASSIISKIVSRHILNRKIF